MKKFLKKIRIFLIIWFLYCSGGHIGYYILNKPYNGMSTTSSNWYDLRCKHPIENSQAKCPKCGLTIHFGWEYLKEHPVIYLDN